MKCSFIIPLYNCLPLTQAMLASLQATVPADFPCETILVDDGSTDGTRDWLQLMSDSCRVILNERNLGFASACNRGAAAAQGELLFLLNNDLVLQPNWLEPILAAFDRFPDAGLVGNVQRNAKTGTVDHTGIYFNHKGKPAHATDSSLWEKLRGVRVTPALTGACLAIRRSLWVELGGFDEGYHNGCEDMDLALRCLAAGRRNYVALRSVIRHHISQSPGRKRRDEENTRRLVEHWQDRIVRLAARDWSRRFIELHWDQSCVYDYALGRAALFHWLQMLPAPPAAILTGVTIALGRERQRWRELLEGQAPAPLPNPAPIVCI